MLCGNRNKVLNHCDLDAGHGGAHEDKRRGTAWITVELTRFKKVTISTVFIATEGVHEVKDGTVQASKWTADKCLFPVWNGTKGVGSKVTSKVKSTK